MFYALNLCRVVLVLYEHIITVHDEIRFIWQRKLSIVAILFYISRYGVMLYAVVNLASGYVEEQKVRIYTATSVNEGY